MSFLLKTIAEALDATLIRGNGELLIEGINTLQDAGPEEVTFLANPAYRKQLETTRAAAVIISASGAEGFHGPALVVENPYLSYARLTAWFAPGNPAPGISPSAVVAESARVDESATIGPHAVIGHEAVIGPGAVIGAGVYVGANASVGLGTLIHPNVTLYHNVHVGDYCIFHSGVVLGADGFGFAKEGRKWVKIHQLGGVVIGDRVEIGACSTVDRGALGNTVIADGVIIDNHVQIAHNVRIGENSAMAAFTGISGSSVIGDNCTLAGKVGVVGHIRICAGVHVSAGTIISKSITEPGSYSSGTSMSNTRQWRKNAARFNQLDDLARRLAAVEKKLRKPE